MALPKSISIGDLAKRNAESREQRDAEKAGSTSNGRQQKGR
ncbi:hypothetical protein ACFWED_10410 [Streptomyces anulatus]